MSHRLWCWALGFSGIVFLAAATVLLHGGWWPVGLAMLCWGVGSIRLSWVERAAHRRRVAERRWLQQWATGKRPAPLEPCCPLFRQTDQTLHDNLRCTRDRTDEMFARIVQQYGREEDR